MVLRAFPVKSGVGYRTLTVTYVCIYIVCTLLYLHMYVPIYIYKITITPQTNYNTRIYTVCDYTIGQCSCSKRPLEALYTVDQNRLSSGVITSIQMSLVLVLQSSVDRRHYPYPLQLQPYCYAIFVLYIVPCCVAVFVLCIVYLMEPGKDLCSISLTCYVNTHTHTWI